MFTHVFSTMGTVVSIQSPAALRDELTRGVESLFAEYDHRFSLYRPDSEASQIAGGELSLPRASEAFRLVYAQAVEWEQATDRAFKPYRPDGVLDLSGIVKSVAIAAAGRLLGEQGPVDWMLNAGGDLLAAGAPGEGSWRFGIVDPSDRTRLLCEAPLEGAHKAVATSGTSERGDHIWYTNERSDIRQATVVAGSIEEADVLATAIVSGGSETMQSVLEFRDVDVAAVDTQGTVWASPWLRRSSTLLTAHQQSPAFSALNLQTA